MQKLNDTTNEQTDGLEIEFAADVHIILEQGSSGHIGRVAIHPKHLQYLAEKKDMAGDNASTARKTIATLTRRLQLLDSRIQHLDDWLCTMSDTKHADLNYEIGYSGGTAAMSAEFCAELDDMVTQDAAQAHTSAAKPLATPSAKAAPKQASFL